MAAIAGKKKPSVLRGAVIAYLGLTLLLGGSFYLMILGAVMIGLGVANIVKTITGKKTSEEKKSVFQTPVTKVKKTAARNDCPPSCAGEPRPAPMSRREKELEQLNSLYAAGLYDKQEYIQKRRKILSGQ